MQHREVRNGDGLHPLDESLTARMGMCHLAASKHQLARSWGGSVSVPACPVLRDTAKDKAGSSHVLPTRRGGTCQPSNTLNCPQESLLLYPRRAHSSCLGAA